MSKQVSSYCRKENSLSMYARVWMWSFRRFIPCSAFIHVYYMFLKKKILHELLWTIIQKSVNVFWMQWFEFKGLANLNIGQSFPKLLHPLLKKTQNICFLLLLDMFLHSKRETIFCKLCNVVNFQTQTKTVIWSFTGIILIQSFRFILSLCFILSYLL